MMCIAACLLLLTQVETPQQSPSAPLLEQPAGRACHSAAATDEGVYVWGGARACGVDVLSDASLWLWNGAHWRALAGPPIPPREDALLVAGRDDSSLTSLTLLGGRRAANVHADLWRFDGREWRAIRASGGPGPIEHGAAAYDPLRKRIVVFGGAAARSLGGKTYEWDGAAWHTFDVPGPAPRVGHAMAWSAADGGVLLYGGFASDEPFRDLWKWDGARWERLSATGPTFTEGHVLAEADDGVFVVGPGSTEAKTVRVWRWHKGEFQLASEQGPPLRVGATATYDRKRKVLVYFGGADATGPSATAHEWNGTHWKDSAPAK